MSNINEYGFPFTSADGDRTYSASEWRDYFSALFSNGVVDGALNELKVNPQAIPNKTIFVETGVVVINGAIRILNATSVLACEENTSGNPRIDRIVARFNALDRRIELAVKQGTPGAAPTPPALTRGSDIYELSIARILLANGYSAIGAGDITDERLDEAVCGHSKTAYMQTFDDENNLLKYERDVTAVDSGGNPTEIRYKRPSDASLFLKRVYSNPDASNRYQTITETLYLPDGITTYKTIVYSLTYIGAGTVIDTMTREVTQ